MSGLLELAERCEKAEGPDRVLDALLYCAAADSEFKKFITPQAGLPPVAFRTSRGDVGFYGCPQFTSSIDAAMTLVPADVEPLSFQFKITGCRRDGWKVGIGAYSGEANTPALALCAAALRARAGQSSLDDQQRLGQDFDNNPIP